MVFLKKPYCALNFRLFFDDKSFMCRCVINHIKINHMKSIRIFTTLLALLLTFSCSNSSDDEEIQDLDFTFEGVWALRDITDINVNGNTVPTELSQQITGLLDLIINEGCEWMAFDFNPDESFILNQYEVTDYNPTTEEVDYVVNCENIDMFDGTWNLEEGLLTISDQEGTIGSFFVRFESGSMILEDVPLGAILPVDGHGNFVFQKLSNDG